MAFIKNKKIIIAIAVVVAAVAAAICIKVIGDNTLYTVSKAGIEDNSAITLISHRGMSMLAPENTLEAAEKSAENGYGYVEFDVRRSLDGVWVLMHDSDIKRTTQGKGEVSSLTYKQLLANRIDEGKNLRDYEPVTIPTLKEMLELCAANNLTPVIEIKQSGTEHLWELLQTISSKCNGNFMIISFNREQIETIHSILNSGKIALNKESISLFWLTSDLKEETLQTALSNTDIGVSFNGNEKIKKEQIDSFTSHGIELATWTINKPRVMKKLYSYGIRTFTTDTITNNPTEEG